MKKQSLYTERVESGKRSFYFDIRESEKGSNYLVISELNKKEEGGTDRRQIIIFENEIDRFGASFVRSLLHFTQKTSSKTARIEEAKVKYARAYEPWSKKEDAELALLFSQGKMVDDIAQSLKRQPGAIKLRIDKLELVKPQAA